MANPTTNYGFVLPTSTDLVTDLPADFDVALQGVDTRLKALQPGTTLGDISYSSATANTNTRLGIGTNGQVLSISSGVPAWATLASASGPAFRATRTSSNQSITASTVTKVQFNTETFDTDNCFDSTTNYRFTPTKSGYYQINTSLCYEAGSTGRLVVYFYKNGTEYSRTFDSPDQPTYGVRGAGDLISMNGTTDYVEVYINVGGSSPVVATQTTQFSGVWIRS